MIVIHDGKTIYGYGADDAEAVELAHDDHGLHRNFSAPPFRSDEATDALAAKIEAATRAFPEVGMLPNGRVGTAEEADLQRLPGATPEPLTPQQQPSQAEPSRDWIKGPSGRAAQADGGAHGAGRPESPRQGQRWVGARPRTVTA
jgi:hypothetical protein